MPSKFEKIVAFSLIKAATYYKPRLSTQVAIKFYRRWGMRIEGDPNYISSKVWFDGTDYSLITLGEGCTISSYIRFLTHDWSPNTVMKGMGYKLSDPVGRTLPVSIGNYCFIGTGSIIMPGSDIGECSIVGAGTVVRGKIKPYSIVVGSPCEVIGDTREYISKKFKDHPLIETFKSI